MGIVLGIDEAGRGCWAGPLVAAAVIIKEPIEGLQDSKRLDRNKRTSLAALIQKNAYVGIGLVEATEIDNIGLTAATTKAMLTAVKQIAGPYDKIVIDGNYNYLPQLTNVSTLVKADATVAEVSAASIIAKVTRDTYMLQAAKRYPDYQFERHVGYGTKLHNEMLKLHGVCELHRRSYKPVQAVIGRQNV